MKLSSLIKVLSTFISSFFYVFLLTLFPKTRENIVFECSTYSIVNSYLFVNICKTLFCILAVSDLDYSYLDGNRLLSRGLSGKVCHQNVRTIGALSESLTGLLNGTLEAYRCPLLALLTHESASIVEDGPYYGLADQNPVFLVHALVVGFVVFYNLAIDNVSWMLVDLSPSAT